MTTIPHPEPRIPNPATMNALNTEPTKDDIEAARRLGEATQLLEYEVRKVIVGQDEVMEQLLIALFANAHCFMVGVPGLAKTLMVSTLAEVLSLSFKRIQFTPDLMPSDITGTDVMQVDPDSGRHEFEFMPRGRSSRTSSSRRDQPNPAQDPGRAAGGDAGAAGHRRTTTYHPEKPFFVLATQNPIEQEGTYPLPEAQLDRFMFNILVDYPKREEEIRIYQATTVRQEHELTTVLTGEQIMELQDLVRRVPVGDHVFQYALELVSRTRPGQEGTPSFINDWLDVGAGPRAGQCLILGAKARALMKGRFVATTDDIAALALPVLRHRLVTNFNAETEGITADDIVRRLLKEVPKPKEE